jgi:acetolactate synthase I/II/III large subunit
LRVTPAMEARVSNRLWSLDEPGVRIDRAGDLGDAVKAAIAGGKQYLIDANIGADLNPGGAGVWELPGLWRSRPLIGGRYEL